MVNSLGAVFLTVFLAVTAFSVALAGYYYSTIGAGLEARVKSAAGTSSVRTLSDYRQQAQSYASKFDERDSIQLQFISPTGTVQYSSYASTESFGLNAGTVPNTPDVAGAIQNVEQTSWTGSDPQTGEHIMAVSSPMLVGGKVVAVARMVTSLRMVDRQIVTVIALALLVGVLIIVLVYFSNLYFVRSIVEPLAGITESAKRIAGGSYGIQIEKKFDDEIGDLTDTINDMSMKVKQSEKLQSEFISSVSHELRTPLTAINGWAETIMNGEVRDAEDVKKGMGIIVSEARRLTNMVEELLEFSRIEDGRFTLSIEPVDIKAELEDAVYTYKEFFRREGITLEYTDCDEEFDPIPADPQRLRQVFSNLFDNAAKHGGSGKRIDASITAGEDSVVIAIRDYGPGIPEEELPHVKYKFYKGSSKARGSGIGLAVCDEIVTRHGGTLDVGNAEGGGCVVTIRLPVHGT
ncbi:ATPase/histidine kinase/DNA gyrase B/HSP90 domain protein [uncultured Eubacteriales bacterium]|uniref:histidine kinase n=1 Tax=uncultured Eubacteriales bacterium TaxID=172733 RepID=A0A212K9I2_9FIRM|nr:ATPase/histidine kinase/DNA gyrase B/HSP90 domain protein [uncultured Eubacteriales bacterium]